MELNEEIKRGALHCLPLLLPNWQLLSLSGLSSEAISGQNPALSHCLLESLKETGFFFTRLSAHGLAPSFP
jgi:hypothetical protein